MRLLLLGNLRASNSTENDWKHGFEESGYRVDTVQEDDWIAGRVPLREPDGDVMLLWVRTWPAPPDLVDRDLTAWKSAAVPIVGAHLDRWFGLVGRGDRMNLIYTDPYFEWMDWWFTSDPCAHHWEKAGINAVWMPPAVSTRNVLTAEPNPRRWGGSVVFVGNTDPDSYHPEHTHRFAMLAKLRKRYGLEFVELPGRGRPRIIGSDMAEIYATYPVVVGDSCLTGLDAYWSDRVPETTGRGGYLVHPDTLWRGQYSPGVHFDVWRWGDWDHMTAVIDRALNQPEYRHTVATVGRTHTLNHHTYTHRAATILDRLAG